MPLWPVLIAAFAVCLFGALPVAAQEVGVVTDSQGRAVLVSGGRQVPAARAMRVRRGDEIVTGADGTVQLAFDDRTRVVVGPASAFRVDDVRMTGGGRASRFAVRALSGTFRFLSGTSDKAAYSITTPTATMGVRGTQFDFSVQRSRPTHLVTFDGQVRICGRRRSCALVSGGCAVVSVDPSGIAVPETRAERDELLVREFPFVLSQDRLSRAFRARTESCGEITAAVLRDEARSPRRGAAAAPVAEPPVPHRDPPPPDDPAAPPAPEPESPAAPGRQAGFPGQSGGADDPGPSQGIGHTRSLDAGGQGRGHGKERTGGSAGGNRGGGGAAPSPGGADPAQ